MSRLSRAFRQSIIFQVLSGDKNRLTRTSNSHDIDLLLQSLKPVPIAAPLIRIGSDADGGYLVPDLLDGISSCFSTGVSTNSDFENDLAIRGIKSFLADYSVDAPPILNPKFVFEKKFLGRSNDDVYMRMDDWVARNAPGHSNDLLLQMDIEGAEYPVLLDVSDNTLSRFQVMVIEFHNFDMAFEANGLVLLNAVFDKLLRQFSPVHIHPNNYSPAHKQYDLEIQPVLEFTFLRNDLVERSSHSIRFPHPLDRSNIRGRADMVLPKYWWS